MFDFRNDEGRTVVVSLDGSIPKVTIERRNTNDCAERGYRLDMALELIIEDAIADALECPRCKRA
jgi:hypothetical protein